ncbi:MAG: four helix bundle protein [Patescibacteria group bacterium]|nr:four helix bundle protein [Patescibacteria group bacterium]
MLDVNSQNHNLNLKSNIKYRAYNFSLMVIKFVATLPDKGIYWVFRDQLLRSGTSIGANIIEAKASSSKRDFIKFYEIALKSANETKYWLCLLRDSGLVERPKIENILKETTELCNMLGSSVLTMKGKKRI